MGSKTFTHDPRWVQWRVPTGVKWIYVTVNGAGSGDRKGGRVQGRFNVEGIRDLYVQTGGAGSAPSGGTGGAGGYGGGAKGGNGTTRGGYGGGGATIVRAGSPTGTIKAVAGGAGGASGDHGPGGQGGDEIGESGYPAPGYPGAFQPDADNYPWMWDYQAIGNATGGTQVQGGNGGQQGADNTLDGSNGSDAQTSFAGAGGTGGTHGGGGGGGGYLSGGGGQAGSTVLDVPAGGGGGGSSHVEAMVGATSIRGGGSTGNGSVFFSWDEPGAAKQPPTPPTEVKFGNDDAVEEFPSLSVGGLRISAKVSDPNNQRLRLVVQYSPDSSFRTGVKEVTSPAVDRNKRATVNLTSLVQNTLYHARLYTKDSTGLVSRNYTGVSWWTNRFPLEPTPSSPGVNASVSELSTVVFQWAHNDPDPDSTQRAFRLRWRRKATPGIVAGPWTWAAQDIGHRPTEASVVVWDNYWTEAPGTFKANSFYEWQVATMDQQGAWGPYSPTQSFFVTGETAPPTLTYPLDDQAVIVEDAITFQWIFRDPTQGETQGKADLRYRVVGAQDWVTLLGDTITPGTTNAWTLPPESLAPRYRYEWQVRTQDSALSDPSDWSDSEFFWTVSAPGVVEPLLVPVATSIDQALGCGMSRVFVYDRGGKVLRGEITPLANLSWSRRRDDIASINITSNGFGAECGQLLGDLHSWIHELVVYRDGVRVAEGPITSVTYHHDRVEVEAKDVMAYVYRRIMRQGYNDAYRIVNGEQLGLSSVVTRASRIILNAMAPDDPNILPYLTSLNFPDDARTSRSVPDWSRTAWEEVDDLAATGGLDYTTVGRRIMLWDTHRPLGRLPEMRTEHFGDPPIISQYGMQLATGFGVTNNNGIYGFAERGNTAASPYGIIEQLASAYGEDEAAGTEETLTSESRTRLEEVLTDQAERNIAGRYPTPLVVRVPDNSTLQPDTPVHINDLVPGVWIPLRAKTAVKEVAQWQKLDLVTVEQTDTGERVMVTMSPAPNKGEDPDATGATVEEG